MPFKEEKALVTLNQGQLYGGQSDMAAFAKAQVYATLSIAAPSMSETETEDQNAAE
jgi:hypothetical protein